MSIPTYIRERNKSLDNLIYAYNAASLKVQDTSLLGIDENCQESLKSFNRQSSLQFLDKVIEEAEGMKREGLQELEDPTEKGQYYYSCKTCGGQDDCDCTGYNTALEDLITKLREAQGEIRQGGVDD